MDGYADVRGLAMDISRRLLHASHARENHADAGHAEHEGSHVEHNSRDLRIAAMFIIMFASALGFLIPVVFTKWKRMQFSLESRALLVGKAFSAGVVVATALVHMFPVAIYSFDSDTLAGNPWRKFQWAGAMTTLSALLTHVFDFVATARIQRKHGMKEEASSTGLKTAEAGGALVDAKMCKTFGTEGKGGGVVDYQEHRDQDREMLTHNIGDQEHKDQDWEMLTRNIVVAEILEYGIVSHSILIGIALGVLTSLSGIRPLLIALAFHQFFEGIALGACGVQAQFKNLSLAFMCLIFSLSTATGVLIGILISKSYKEKSTQAVLVHGFFNSLAAGILLYNGLVSLLANDFFSKRMKSDHTLQVMAYIALFAGAAAMTVLSIWA